MIGGPIIPPAFTVPLSVLLMILVSIHAATTLSSDAPPSRKRIRLANAVLSVFTLSLLMAGFSLIDADHQPRAWALVWLTAMAMMILVLIMAALDIANTMRLALRTRRKLQQRLHRMATHRDAGTPQLDPKEGHDHAEP